MARKPTKTRKSFSIVTDLPKQVDKARGQAQKLVERTVEQTLDLLPAQQRKAVKALPKRMAKVRTQAEKLVERNWNRTLGLLPAGQRKAVKDLPKRIEKVTKQLEQRRERTLKTVEQQRQRLIAQVEEGTTRVFRPLLERLDVASRSDVEQLGKRLVQIERRIRNQVKPRQKAAA